MDRNTEVKDLKILADLMDSKFELPLGIRIGFDGVLGIIPVIGGLLTTGVSSYIVARAAMLQVSVPVLLRMILNIVIDNAIAIIPVVGWFGDFVWKSNNKNLALIESHGNDPVRTTRHAKGVLLFILATLLVTTFALAFCAAVAAWWTMNLVLGWLNVV